MELNNEKQTALKELITKYQNDINNHKFKALYEDAKKAELEPYVTKLLFDLGINPLNSEDFKNSYVPEFFAYNVNHQNLVNITDNTIANLETIYERAFSNCNVEHINLSCVYAIAEGAFENCKNLKSIKISNTSDGIRLEEEAFINCQNLESVEIDSNTSIIRENCFTGCKNLKHVKFTKQSCDEINIYRGCFAFCKNLEITFPKNVNRIFVGDAVFYGCSNITINAYSYQKAWITSEFPREYNNIVKFNILDADNTQTNP